MNNKNIKCTVCTYADKICENHDNEYFLYIFYVNVHD